MNKILIVAVISIFFFIYAMLNFYIGLRGWQAFGGFLPWLNSKVYWTAFWFLAMAYLLGRVAQRYLPEAVSYWLTLVGAYWLGAMFYFVLILFTVDIVRLLNRWLHFLPSSVTASPLSAPVIGAVVILSVAGILIYGAWNARHLQVRHYTLTIPKKAGELKSLHAVMVSDVHLGEIIHNGRLTKMVDIINGLHPDIVLLPGDIIDENIGPFVEQRMSETFLKIKPRFGMYAVPGNHEYIGGHLQEAEHYLEEAGIQLLRDRYVKVAGSFYVVGRDDRHYDRRSAMPRRSLESIMQGIDKALPVIELDHQPVQLDEAQKQGVDLQLSGHTHAGQLFPNRLITSRMYEDDWGYLRKDSLQVIVSSGFGTWGPPIRTGNSPEIVDIEINFAS